MATDSDQVYERRRGSATRLMRLCVGLAVVHLLLWLLLVRALGDTGVALMVAPASR